MRGNQCWRLVVLGMLLMGSGCCHWCDKWCNQRPAYAAPVQACVPYAPACAPACAPAACPPGCAPVTVQPGGGFQRNYGPVAPNCCQQ